jgi:hypothetical protein
VTMQSTRENRRQIHPIMQNIVTSPVTCSLGKYMYFSAKLVISYSQFVLGDENADSPKESSA